MAHTDSPAEVAGRPVVLSYSGMAAEYEALRRRAIVVDRSHRGRMRFTGDKAADVLTGLVTSDVGALAPGQGQYAAALSPKGKVMADLRILRTEDAFVTDASPRSRDAWAGIVRKFVNPRLARYRDESDDLRAIGVYGVQARHVVEAATGLGHSALALLPPFAHAAVARADSSVLVLRSPDLGVEGYDLFVPAGLFEATWDALVSAKAVPAGQAACEVARVEAGRPEFGIDMDDSTIPQEALLDGLEAISFTKGCYTGQETVARVHFRGHVNRTLRGLKAAAAHPPPGGSALFDVGGKPVGDVRSAVSSPRLGGIALGMVRREVDDGAQLVARWSADIAGDTPAGEMALDVVPLPFPA